MKNQFLKYLEFELNRSPQTVTAYGRDLAELAAFLGMPADMPEAAAISTSDIRAWLADMSRKGLSPRSLRRKTQAARAFFRWIQKMQIIDRNPAMEVQLAKIGRKLPEFVREKEMEQLLSSPVEDGNPILEQRNRLILNILYSCGLRRDELVKITDADINVHSGELRVHGKRDKTRVMPLPDALLTEIKDWQKVRDANFDLPKPAPLICSPRGRLSSNMVYAIVHRMLLSTGATHKSPHTLRHTFATSLLNDGAEISSVKELLGHSSLQSTQIYTHLTFSEIQKAYSSAHPRARKPGK